MKLPRLRTPEPWETILILFVTIIVLTISGILYTNRVQRQADKRNEQLRIESEQKWCDVVKTLDGDYKANPPQSTLGKELAADMVKLVHEFHCR